jgi:hypothetical protein
MIGENKKLKKYVLRLTKLPAPALHQAVILQDDRYQSLGQLRRQERLDEVKSRNQEEKGWDACAREESNSSAQTKARE